MARYTGPLCKLCRREGMKLCDKRNCAYEKRSYPPGMHGQNMRRKQSEYALQLREKQKTKRIYGVLENQFRNYYLKAARRKGVTGEVLLQMLECRLDNMVYRFGFAPTRRSARQLVRHGHIAVNGRVVNIPSFQVARGDAVQVREKSRQMPLIQDALKDAVFPDQSVWLSVDKANLSATLDAYPNRDDIPTQVEEQLIVEFYSKQ
ncbi:MAG: 30S ribosomal protein S4 [Candidatus Tectomicrobia bacterium]|nr:30S ribosomal protein S4 [Candidatus Tectomicrobia bacterium]